MYRIVSAFGTHDGTRFRATPIAASNRSHIDENVVDDRQAALCGQGNRGVSFHDVAGELIVDNVGLSTIRALRNRQTRANAAIAIASGDGSPSLSRVGQAENNLAQSLRAPL